MKIRFGIISVAILITLSGCKKADESPLENLFTLGEEAKVREAQRLEREKKIQKREQEECLSREKEEAVNLRTALSPLVKSRKQRIQEDAAKLMAGLKVIATDRREFDEAMASVEDKRGLEYTVYNIMTNQTLNALAVRYTGGDFNALKSEFVESVRFHKTSTTELTQTLKKNREEYRNQVTGIDQAVDNANTSAQTSINATHANIQRKISELEQRKEVIARRLTGKTENAETKKIDEQLERLYQVLEVSSGSTLHIKATSLETGTRRKFDIALEDKTVKDAEALKKSQFNGDMYNAAQDFRGRSIDRLLNAMTTQASVLSERLNSVETTLQELEDSETRMSLMEYPDLIKLREAITQDARLKLESGLTAPAKLPSL